MLEMVVVEADVVAAAATLAATEAPTGNLGAGGFAF